MSHNSDPYDPGYLESIPEHQMNSTMQQEPASSLDQSQMTESEAPSVGGKPHVNLVPGATRGLLGGAADPPPVVGTRRVQAIRAPISGGREQTPTNIDQQKRTADVPSTRRVLANDQLSVSSAASASVTLKDTEIEHPGESSVAFPPDTAQAQEQLFAYKA